MKDDILVFTSFSAFLTGIICATILLTFKKRQSFPNVLLALALIGISLISLSNTFIYTEFYLRFPHFYRSAFPFHYAVPPLLYIYVRTTLSRESKFRKYDWVFFIPAMLHLVEYTPFYLSTAEEKRMVIRELVYNPKIFAMHRGGWLPPYFHPSLKSALGLLYTLFALIKLREFRNTANEWLSKNKRVWYWLVLLEIQLGAYFLTMLTGIAFRNYVGDLSGYYTISLTLLLFFISIILLFRPEILYGLAPLHTYEEKNKEPRASSRWSLDPNKKMDLKDRVENFLDQKKPFLKKRYTLAQMAEDTDIPVHQLSSLINEVYDVNFNTLINTRRIDYILSRYQSEDLKTLTLEGIAKNGGFNSRYTFIKAFKKIKGVTPSEYFNSN